MRNERLGDELDVRNPDQARCFLEFYLFETWEKILQTRAFVNSREYRKSRRNWPTIAHFSAVLDRLTLRLDESVVPFLLRLDGSKQFIFDDFVGSVLSIKSVLDALFGLHRKLGLLSGRAESPVAYDFVRKLKTDALGEIAERSAWLPRLPSIALDDDYSFIEYDLRSILSRQMLSFGFNRLVIASQNTVLVLPKAEADNPLMWGILARESAHSLVDSYSILREILAGARGYEDADRDSQRIYRSWSREICADLVALRLLGPAYVFSLASMGLLVDSAPVTTDHPEVVNRIGSMVKAIAKYHTQWEVRCPGGDSSVFTQQDLVSFFFRLAQYRHELWSMQDYRSEFTPTYCEGPDPILMPEFRKIHDVLERVQVPETSLLSPAQLSSVLQDLRSGQPVSSIPASDLDRTKFHSKLCAADNPDELYDLLPQPERPLSLSSILVCGWMLKLYYDFGHLQELLSEKGSLLETADTYHSMLHRRNHLIQQSIRRAFMMDMYWRWREDEDGR